MKGSSALGLYAASPASARAGASSCRAQVWQPRSALLHHDLASQ